MAGQGPDQGEALTFIDGEWHTGNPPIMGATTHAAWLGSVVFDGARAFEGTAPDLDLHCQRVIDSAIGMGLGPKLTAEEIEGIALDGVKRFPEGQALYIRPMFFAESGSRILQPDPDSTRFVLTLFDSPLPPPSGFSACLSETTRRPTPESALTHIKASCLYPIGARAVAEAGQRGYDNAVVRDGLGNIAEFATANIFMVKDGVAKTPPPNGTFLNGVTRRRVIQLLTDDGAPLSEEVLTQEDLLDADEIFSTGNYGKVTPVIRYEDRDLQPGPVFRRARELYWDFAHSA